MRKKEEKILKEQNEKTKKIIAKDKGELIEQIERAKEACIIITEEDGSIIGGYVQCRRAITNAFVNFLAQGIFDANDLREMVATAVIANVAGPLFKEEWMDGVDDGRK